jgi:hypothetical protein
MSSSVSPACQNDLVLLLQGGTLAGLCDSQLLDQFLARRDTAGEAAFGALVNRHGPIRATRDDLPSSKNLASHSA